MIEYRITRVTTATVELEAKGIWEAAELAKPALATTATVESRLLIERKDDGRKSKISADPTRSSTARTPGGP
jgi:hypothetical protein